MPSTRLFCLLLANGLDFITMALLIHPDRYSEILCAQRNFPCSRRYLVYAFREVQNWPITDLSRCESQLVSLSTGHTSPNMD